MSARKERRDELHGMLRVFSWKFLRMIAPILKKKRVRLDERQEIEDFLTSHCGSSLEVTVLVGLHSVDESSKNS